MAWFSCLECQRYFRNYQIDKKIEEDMNKLFAPFQKIDMSSTKSFEGTGLGLHLSKKLASLLGGDISAKSE